MNIPDEVHAQAIEAGEFNDGDYKVIAEWARKEALLEAASAAGYEDWALMQFSDEPNDFTDWLRALAEGDD